MVYSKTFSMVCFIVKQFIECPSYICFLFKTCVNSCSRRNHVDCLQGGKVLKSLEHQQNHNHISEEKNIVQVIVNEIKTLVSEWKPILPNDQENVTELDDTFWDMVIRTEFVMQRLMTTKVCHIFIFYI